LVIFALAIVFGAARFSWLSGARNFRINLERNRSNIRDQLWNLQNSCDLSEKFDKILTDTFQEAYKPTAKGIKVIDILSGTMFLIFTLGIILLTLYAIINIPY